MKKSLVISILCFVCVSISFAQIQATDKGKTGQKIANTTNKIANTTSETAQNTQAIAQNVKDIVRIFEPFRIQFKKESKVEVVDGTLQGGSIYNVNVGENQSNNQQNTEQTTNTVQDNNTPVITSPSGNYSSDGTANLGTQNHATYGNYLDMNKGEILDNVTAPAVSESVDLIFTATKWANNTLYAFFSPYFAKNNAATMKYNFGSKYKRNEKHPATNWATVNESQVALTNLNEAQFNKIQNSAQLEAYVKQVQNFKESLEIQNNIEGKVLAIKTQMDNRTCYGLLYIVNQYGTVGENSYIKVKLKVLGTDMNGDGLPD
jgi:hypothetical protein